MSREWKPGDVAMVNDCTRPDAPWKAATCKEAAIPGQHEAVWILHDSGAKVWGSVSTARPLVVIDPEDREQVERLIGAVHHVDPDGIEPHDIDEMQAALREFANPTPRIEEPTNLYAVVRDANNNEWCHVGGQVWRSLSSTGQFMVEKHWHDSGTPLAGNVVEVLAEGQVTS